MKTITANETEVLNDLIKINNDRIAGYEKAARETSPEDNDLRVLFDKMAAESRICVSELSRHTMERGEEPTTGTTLSGKIYRAWMDVKATFSGKDKKAILAACEYGEDAAQKAYESALEDRDEFSQEIVALVQQQQARLKQSHDKIKAMRDRA